MTYLINKTYLEKVNDLIKMHANDTDLIIYWHTQTVWDEAREELKNHD